MYIDVAAAVLTAALTGHHGQVTVQPGDSLSGIAARYCGDPDRYPGLAAASNIRNPDLIYPGQRVTLACHTIAAATTGQVRPAAGRHARPDSRGRVWGVTYGYPNFCGDGDGDGYDLPCSQLHRNAAPAAAPAPARRGRHARTYTSTSSRGGGGTYRGSPGCQAHIIADESGGNARAVNPSSGAGGLFQFLPSTWRALGHSGLPQNASVAEQNQAYHQQVAQSGYSAWAASGGCG